MSRLYSWGGQPHRQPGSVRHGPAPLSLSLSLPLQSAAAPVPLGGPLVGGAGTEGRGETCTNPMLGSSATLLVRGQMEIQIRLDVVCVHGAVTRPNQNIFGIFEVNEKVRPLNLCERMKEGREEQEELSYALWWGPFVP